jgi:hypothetical protein
MANLPKSLELNAPSQTGEKSWFSNLRRWLNWLQWIAPVGMILIVAAYELGPGRWLNDYLGETHHETAEILFYGTFGPLLVFVLLHFIRRWLDEKETSDLQAQILRKAHEKVKDTHSATDDAMQALFAASVLLNSLEAKGTELKPEELAAIRDTRQALEVSIQRLRAQLMK